MGVKLAALYVPALAPYLRAFLNQMFVAGLLVAVCVVLVSLRDPAPARVAAAGSAAPAPIDLTPSRAYWWLGGLVLISIAALYAVFF